MRNHRLFGVAIAVLLGTSFVHQRPSSPHHHHQLNAGTHAKGAGMQLASAALPAAPSHTPFAAGVGPPTGLLRMTGTGYSATLARLTSPSPVHQPAAPAAPAQESHIGLLRPAGTRYVTQLYTWMAYEAAHTPPPAPKPVPVPTPKVATPAVHVVPVTAPHHAPAPVVPVTPVAPATTPASGAVIGGVWAGLRQCESGGNYSDNTGNGYYGAYQFSLATWQGLGYSGLPSSAPPAVQDQAAQKLQARSGWGQWPACSRRLGLT